MIDVVSNFFYLSLNAHLLQAVLKYYLTSCPHKPPLLHRALGINITIKTSYYSTGEINWTLPAYIIFNGHLPVPPKSYRSGLWHCYQRPRKIMASFFCISYRKAAINKNTFCSKVIKLGSNFDLRFIAFETWLIK